jgi:hypothetical protein
MDGVALPLDLSSAPGQAVAWLLASSLRLERPFDVGWVRLPGIVPHRGSFEAACAACGGILTVHVLDAPRGAWAAVEENAEAFMAGQCPRCLTVTWGSIAPAEDPPRARP